MKEKKYNHVLKSMILLLLFGLALGCSNDDDEPSNVVVLNDELITEFQAICCNSAGGCYDINILYSVTRDDALKNIFFEGTLDDGTQAFSVVRDDFEGTELSVDRNVEGFPSNALGWGNVCMDFEGSEWLDIEIQIETTSGVFSNTATDRLFRTDFDN